MSSSTDNRIFSRRWLPDGTTKSRPCGVYILHGTGEHCSRYAALAERLTLEGWVVGAHDHPGHGQSAGKRGQVLPQGVLAVQGAMQIQRFIDETGAAPIVLGHSLGGVLAAQLLLEHHVPASGLILSAPAFQIHMSLKNRLKLNLMRALAPDVVIELQYNPEFLTHDSEIQAQSKNDALIHGFKSARLVHWIEHTGNNAIALAHTLTVDALVLIAAADPVAKPSAARQWASNAPTRQITVQEYADSYHEIFNELPAIRDKATEDTLEWLDTLSGALQTNA